MTAASSGRTVRLRERMPRDVRLSPADAAFLLASHRPHIELSPTTRRHVYRLISRGYAGVIVAPRCRFILRPKIPLANLFHLLDPLAEMPFVSDAVIPADGDALTNFLAGRLARCLAERGAAGLQRGYHEVENTGPFLRGRLNVAAQLRDGPNRMDRLHSREDAFTADMPWNCLPKTTALRLLACPHVGDSVRAALRQALIPFSEVTPTPVSVEAFDELLSRPLPEEYRPLLALCRLLVGAMESGDDAGLVSAPAFLLEMERVFERYLTERLTADLAKVDSQLLLAPQRRTVVSEPVAGQPGLTIRPDLVLSAAGRDLVIVDAKWKRLDGTSLVTPDVYQMLAYCTALGVRRGVLIYPGSRDRRQDYRLAGAPITLTIRTLRVVGAAEALTNSLTRLARWLRREAETARRNI